MKECNNYKANILIFIMKTSNKEVQTFRLRNTLYEIKQLATKDYNNASYPRAQPIVISLASTFIYKNKRKLEQYNKQKSNRQNMENQLRDEIFRKIKDNMLINRKYNGFEVTKATVHMQQRVKTVTSERESATRKANVQDSSQEKQSLKRLNRLTTDNGISSYRPYESCNHYYQKRQNRAGKNPNLRFLTERSNFSQNKETDFNELRGWNIQCEQQDF